MTDFQTNWFIWENFFVLANMPITRSTIVQLVHTWFNVANYFQLQYVCRVEHDKPPNHLVILDNFVFDSYSTKMLVDFRGGFFGVKRHVYMHEDVHFLCKMRIFTQINMPFWCKTACLSA